MLPEEYSPYLSPKLRQNYNEVIPPAEPKAPSLMAEDEKGALSFVSPKEGWGNGFGVS